MIRKIALAWIASTSFAAAGCVAATGSDDLEVVTTDSESDRLLRQAANADEALAKEIATLRENGWSVGAIAHAPIEHVTVPATGDSAATDLTRLALPATKGEARAHVLFARTKEGETSVGVRPENDAARQIFAVDDDAEGGERAGESSCVSSCRYVSKRGTNLVCFDNTFNPLSQYYYHTYRVRLQGPVAACNSLYASYKGCGVMCPTLNRVSSVFICGVIPNRRSCTGL